MYKVILLALVASLWAAPSWGYNENDLKRFLKTGDERVQYLHRR